MFNSKVNLLKNLTEKSAEVRIESHKSAVQSCEFHKNGKFLISSNSGGEIQIYSTDDDFKMLKSLKGHRSDVTEVHYSKNGCNFFSSSLDKTLGVWDSYTGSRKTVIFGHNGFVNTLQCSPKECNVICSGSSDKKIRIWDVRQRNCTAMFRSNHGVLATCFSACGKYVFSGGYSTGIIVSWDIRKQSLFQLLSAHTDAITGLSVSPNGKFLASCSVDGSLRKWSLDSTKQIVDKSRNFRVGELSDMNELRRCAWSKHGRLLATGNTKNNVIVFDAHTGDVLTEFEGHKGAITDVAFHPKKRLLVSAGADNLLMLNDVQKFAF